MRTAFLCRLTGALILAACAISAQAQQFPSKPITIIVPFPAGSITDVVARNIAEKMRVSLGQPVIVEAKPSVGGIVGAAHVARATPDGHTILLGSNSTNSINQSLFRHLPYDPGKELIPVSMAGEIPAVMIARADHPANDLKEVIQLAKSKPGQLSVGIGNTTSRVASEMLQKNAGFQWITVPYKGEPLAVNDLLGGQIDYVFLNLPVAYPMLKAGKVKAIALTGADRVEMMPDIPRANETQPDFMMPNGWLAFFAPAGTPRPVVERLNKEVEAALKAPDVIQKLEGTGGYIVRYSSPEELGTRVRHDKERWASLIKTANIPLQ